MSNPILTMARQLADCEVQDAGPAETLAHAYLHLHRDKLLLEERYSELYKRTNAMTHEIARLRQNVRLSLASERSEPALTVYCDAPDCTTPPLRFQSLPPDEAIPMFIRGRSWATDGDRHMCPEHAKNRTF